MRETSRIQDLEHILDAFYSVFPEGHRGGPAE